MLQVEGVVKSFDDFMAVNEARNSAVRKGEIVAVIGPNGAGKTTLFNLITGHLRRDRGKIFLKGRRSARCLPTKSAAEESGRSFQIVNVFHRLTVFENVQVAVLSQQKKSNTLFRPAESLAVAETRGILESVGLAEKERRIVGSLSHGDQKILEIAIALGNEPELLILDEPTAGMSPEETFATIELIKQLARTRGLTILFCEHDMDIVFSISRSIMVMHQGRTLIQGTSPKRSRAIRKCRPPIWEGSDARKCEGIHTFYGLSHILFGVSLKVAGKGPGLPSRAKRGRKDDDSAQHHRAEPAKARRPSVSGEKTSPGMDPYLLTRKGISYVPDDRRIFADLTVGENLEIAVRKARSRGGWGKERVYEIFPALQNIESRKGGCLSGGEQKMLAVARALMGNPELLLLDEPTEGLAPALVRSLEEQIKELRETGLTVLLAEQNVKSALRLSDRGYIIDNGQIRYQGSIEELRENEEVRKKYLLI